MSLDVFISSTFLDNVERRRIVEDAIIRAGLHPVGMERFAASDRPTVEECERMAASADLFVGILARRYGWIPEGRQTSITELEYEAAKRAGKPRLMFVIDLTQQFTEEELDAEPHRLEKATKLKEFKERLDTLPAQFRDNTLGLVVHHSLINWKESQRDAKHLSGERPTFLSASTVPAVGPKPESAEHVGDTGAYHQPLSLALEHENLSKSSTEHSFLRDREFQDAWKEGAGMTELKRVQPEDIAYQELLESAVSPAPTIWLVLGEPGAGKSELLNRWLRRWVEALPPPQSGRLLPILVRFRDLGEGFLSTQDPLEEILWRHRTGLRGFSQEQLEHYYASPGLGVIPVWFLDGLDEASESIQDALLTERGEAFLARMAQLPGPMVLTCRTAYYQNNRRVLHRPEFDKDHRYFILGLTVEEQQEYLTHRVSDPKSADEIHRSIQANAQLNAISQCPLILNAIAELASERLDAGEPMAIPSSRVGLYEEVMLDAMRRKVGSAGEDDMELCQELIEGAVSLHELASPRIPAACFRESGTRLGMARDESKQLLRHLVQAGLLKKSSFKSFDFSHLTFHEYFLARAYLKRDFTELLFKYWHQPRYSETLALLISLLLKEQRATEVETALVELLSYGEEKTEARRRELSLGHLSPLREVLHLTSRSGAKLRDLATLTAYLHDVSLRSLRRKQLAASDHRCPPELLEWFLEVEPAVGRLVASNPATPEPLLYELAQSETLCAAVQGNRNLSLRIKNYLTDHRRGYYKRYVPWRLPLAEWMSAARSPNEALRYSLPERVGIPPSVLVFLSDDVSADVRWGVAQNWTTPTATIRKLALDPDEGVRRGVTENAKAPSDVLGMLSQEGLFSYFLAYNPNTPRQVLAKLARDKELRDSIAKNPAADKETLAHLAAVDDEHVRGTVAGNASAGVELLAALSTDGAASVRRAVASNPVTAPQTLSGMVDDVAEVQEAVARNPNALLGALERLSRSSDDKVLRAVAGNPATPDGLLNQIAAKTATEVARNPNASPETLAIAGERAASCVSRNPNAVWEFIE